MEDLEERLTTAWIRVSSVIKNGRLTKGLTYNEAVTMHILYDKYISDGIGRISMKDVQNETGMLKSQVNRTITRLERNGFITIEKSDKDRRKTFIRISEGRITDYLRIHDASVDIARKVIEIIGADDAESFIRIGEKLKNNECV